MPRFSFRERLRYGFDNTLTKGTPALIAWLVFASLVFVAITAALVVLTGNTPLADKEPMSFVEVMWHNLMRTLDAGTMGGDEGSASYLLLMLFVTFGGIFSVGTLIGIISSGVDNQIDQLRKGRSLVAEHDHIVILGWNPQIHAVLGELVLGNEHLKRNVIAVLADRDKVEMDDEIRDRLADAKTTRIVTRRGSPVDLGDLDIVNFNGARAIVILPPEQEDPDVEVIKSILALTNHPRRRSEKFHIVAQINRRQNMEPARLVGGDETQLIETGDIIARVVAQTCRQTGLSAVYTELLDYGGDEIYFKEEPTLVGRSFSDALLAFDTSSLIGVRTAAGAVHLNPAMTRLFGPGDQAIVIAKDLAAIRTGTFAPNVDAALLVDRPQSVPKPEKTLLIGWNRRAPIIARELDGYVAPGSVITVLASGPEVVADVEAIRGSMKNQTMQFREGDSTDRATLESVDPEQYQHIIVLCYSDHFDVQKADAKTLVTLLHLRDIETKSGSDRYSIVSEMLDVRNRDLAEITHADDFIVSERLTSLLVAQVTGNKDLRALFGDIFDADGSEIYLKPAGDFVALGRSMSYWHVVESARRRGAVAIGYRSAAASTDAQQGYGVHVNPPKDSVVTFGPDDRVIVVAED